MIFLLLYLKFGIILSPLPTFQFNLLQRFLYLGYPIILYYHLYTPDDLQGYNISYKVSNKNKNIK